MSTSRPCETANIGRMDLYRSSGTAAASSSINSVTAERPLIVFSDPGRASTLDPLLNRTESFVSLSSLTLASIRAKKSENLYISSWLCRRDGESRTITDLGL